MSAETVRQAIEEAFAATPYPGDDAIGAADSEEGADLAEHLRGIHWRAVPRDVLRHHHDDRVFFTPSGLRFYFPAYLIAATEGDWDFLDFVMYHLGSSDEKRFADFSPAEREAVRTFLAHVAEVRPDFGDEVVAALDSLRG